MSCCVVLCCVLCGSACGVVLLVVVVCVWCAVCGVCGAALGKRQWENPYVDSDTPPCVLSKLSRVYWQQVHNACTEVAATQVNRKVEPRLSHSTRL